MSFANGNEEALGGGSGDPLAVRSGSESERLERDVRLQCARMVVPREASALFFAHLLFNLPIRAAEVQTAETDGREIRINPAWWFSLAPQERRGVLCHEVLHLVLQHHRRCGGRDPLVWNVAADLAVNSLLVFPREGGCGRLPEGALLPGTAPFKRLGFQLSAEVYYDQLLKEDAVSALRERQGWNFGWVSSAPPAGLGGVAPVGNEIGGWDARVRQAAQAALREAATVGRGPVRGYRPCRDRLPELIERAVFGPRAARLDWRQELQRFVADACREEFSWLTPNRRSLAGGLILPGRAAAEGRRLAVAIDTSGSIGPDVLEQFVGELLAIAASAHAAVHVYVHDVDVTAVHVFEPGDAAGKLSLPGGGGTSHVPVLERIERDSLSEGFVGAICLTDLFTEFPERAPELPVLWVDSWSRAAGGAAEERKVPFGEVVGL